MMIWSDTMLSQLIFTRHAVRQYRIRCENECGISVPRNAVKLRELISDQLKAAVQIDITIFHNWKRRLQLHPNSMYFLNKEIGMVFVVQRSTMVESAYVLVTCFPPNPKAAEPKRRRPPIDKSYNRAKESRLARLAYENVD